MTKFRTTASKHSGSQHGPITRLIDPSGLGETLKPFIFLDFFHAPVEPGFGFGMHPHSGIATLTWQPGSDIRYEDTTGQKGILKAGGLEWMNAGGGAWHQARFETPGWATGFQLWVAMPPGIEDGASLGQYVAPGDVPTMPIPGGSLRLLLGQMPMGVGTVKSPIETHQDMNCLVIDLAANARWSYRPPSHHDVAWAYVFENTATVADSTGSHELLVLQGPGDIALATGNTAARILMGSALKHPHSLVMGPSSVHTNVDSLREGHARIRTIGKTLAQQGLLRN